MRCSADCHGGAAEAWISRGAQKRKSGRVASAAAAEEEEEVVVVVVVLEEEEVVVLEVVEEEAAEETPCAATMRLTRDSKRASAWVQPSWLSSEQPGRLSSPVAGRLLSTVPSSATSCSYRSYALYRSVVSKLHASMMCEK